MFKGDGDLIESVPYHKAAKPIEMTINRKWPISQNVMHHDFFKTFAKGTTASTIILTYSNDYVCP